MNKNVNVLEAIQQVRRVGSEQFIQNGHFFEQNLLSFWQWSGSDIMGNALRGKLAEYIVATDLGVSEGVRQEWDAFDLLTLDGIKVEVKSASYIQSWSQKKLSEISFTIKPTVKWENDDKRSSVALRQSDVYVFCLLDHKDKSTVNPLDLDQWKFYILPAHILNNKVDTQKTIRLSSLLALEPIQTMYGNINKVIKELSL